MEAVYEAQCGDGDCLCSFKLLDMKLANEWANSVRKYLSASLNFGGTSYAALLPWKLTTVFEHEVSFEKWCMIQFWLGLISTSVLFLVGLIWHITADLVPLGPVITNTLFRLITVVILTWVMWFGVIEKKGCCWAITCCFLGKPNLLAVSVLSAFSAVGTLVLFLEGITSGRALAIVASIILLIHGVAQVFMTIEAFLVWRSSVAATTSETCERSGKDAAASCVGNPVCLGRTSQADGKDVAKEQDLEESALPSTADVEPKSQVQA